VAADDGLGRRRAGAFHRAGIRIDCSLGAATRQLDGARLDATAGQRLDIRLHAGGRAGGAVSKEDVHAPSVVTG
jgi:hypothetical protein